MLATKLLHAIAEKIQEHTDGLFKFTFPQECYGMKDDIQYFLQSHPTLDEQTLIWCVTQLGIYGMSIDEIRYVFGIEERLETPYILIEDALVECLSCGWRGKVKECGEVEHDDGSLDCPLCHHIAVSI